MWERLNYRRLSFLLPPFTLIDMPDGATGTSIKMPKRLGKIKPPILGWETQLAKKTTTFNETLEFPLQHRTSQKRRFIKPKHRRFFRTPHTHTHRHKIQTFQLHYLGYAVYVVDKWCLIFFYFFLSYEEEESFSFLLYNRSIFRDHDFKWITVVCLYFRDRSITQYI